MIDNDFDSPMAQLSRIQEAIDEMPYKVQEAIFDNIPASTMVGSALRQRSGQDLLGRLKGMDPNDMPILAERLVHANRALESGGTLKHVPHGASLLRLIDGVAAMAAEKGGGDEEDASRTFYEYLQKLAPVFPGVDTQGNPLAMDKFYDHSGVDKEDALKFDVIAQAPEELSADMLDDETRAYWEGVVKRQFPHLRDIQDLTVDDIPLSDAEIAFNERDDSWNSTLSKGAGQILYSLTGSNRAGPPAERTIWDDIQDDIDRGDISYETPDANDLIPDVSDGGDEGGSING